jgi:hypothetical protein
VSRGADNLKKVFKKTKFPIDKIKKIYYNIYRDKEIAIKQNKKNKKSA